MIIKRDGKFIECAEIKLEPNRISYTPMIGEEVVLYKKLHLKAAEDALCNNKALDIAKLELVDNNSMLDNSTLGESELDEW